MSDTRATYRTLVGWQIRKIGIALGVLVLFVGVAASLGVKNASVAHVFRIVLDQLTSVQLFPRHPENRA